MASCAFKTDRQYKKLEKQVGSELLATYTYFAYNGYPEMFSDTTLRKEMSVAYAAYDNNIIAMAVKVRRYNHRNGTSHYFTKKRIGQSTQYKIDFQANYLPVNLERQRQKDLARSERDKSWVEFQQKDFKDLTKQELDEYNKIKNQVENDTIEQEFEERFGINEPLPELQVHILGQGQYEVAGEIYPSYEDALVASEEAFPETNSMLPSFSETIVDMDLQTDLENMYPTVKLLSYLYEEGNGTMSEDEFNKEASALMMMMKSDGASNSRIMDAIKCL